MKRLSILIVGLLSIGIIFSVVGLADEADYAIATININETIDLSITSGTLDTVDIQQNDGGDLSLADIGEGTASTTDNMGTLTVTVVSLSKYNIGATYYETGQNETAEGLVYLAESGGTKITDKGPNLKYFNQSSYDFTNNPSDPNNPDANKPVYSSTTLLQLNSYFDHTASNNTFDATDNYDQSSFDAYFDVSKLTQDYGNGDTITLNVTFWAYDATT